MIIKPVRRGGFTAMGKYILDLGENDHTEVLGIFNLPLAKDVWDAMGQMRLMMGEKLQGPHKVNDPFEHIVLRPRKGEILTREQYDKMKAATIKRLGYENCPRIEWEDILHGEAHQHVAILRMDINGVLIHPYMRVKGCIAIAQEFEKKFGLKPALKDSPKAPYHDAKKQVADLWKQTEGKTGQETKAIFEQNGFVLAKGDRGQFILMKDGKPYNPTRISELKEQGLQDAGVKKRFKGVMIDSLPSVKEVQAACGVTQKPFHKKQRRQRNGAKPKTARPARRVSRAPLPWKIPPAYVLQRHHQAFMREQTKPPVRMRRPSLPPMPEPVLQKPARPGSTYLGIRGPGEAYALYKAGLIDLGILLKWCPWLWPYFGND